MSKNRFSSEAWWNSFTAAEREEILRAMAEDGEIEDEEIEKLSEEPTPAKFRAVELFGWG